MANETENGRDDNEELIEEEVDGDGDEGEAEPQPLPRARRARPAGPFGVVPEAATLFSVKKRTDSFAWMYVTHTPPGSAMGARRWPIVELSERFITEKWGAGVYRVHWFGENGASLGKGHEFPIGEPPRAAAPAAPVMPLGGLPAEFHSAIAMLGFIQQMSSNGIETAAKLAGLAGNNGGQQVEMMRMMIESQERQSKAMLVAIREQGEQFRSEIATLRDELIDDGDDDDETSPVVREVAKAVVKPLVKRGDPIGESIMTALANAVATDPIGAANAIGNVLEKAPAALGAITTFVQKKNATRPVARHLHPVPNVPPQTNGAHIEVSEPSPAPVM